MSDKNPSVTETVRDGGCLCGAVRYAATLSGHFATCYCKMCQRWSAGAFMGAPAADFAITQGEDALVVFCSSDWAERAFCSKCGSNIYYAIQKSGQKSVALGSLDDTSGLNVKVQYFVDQKPSGFSLAETTKEMTGEQVAKLFAAHPTNRE